MTLRDRLTRAAGPPTTPVPKGTFRGPQSLDPVGLFMTRAQEADAVVSRVPDRGAALDLVAALEGPVGVCEAAWAVAETGTVVLVHGPDQSRSVSLLPATTAVLLASSRVLPDLGAVLAELYAAGPLPAAVTLVTGPSRTADIELELCLGVHGPVAVHVVLIDDLAG